jgi:hypothetical protein
MTISIMALMKTTISIANVSIMAGKPYRRRRFSTVHLLALTIIDQLLFYNKTLFNLFTKLPDLMRRSTVLSIPLQLVFHDNVAENIVTLQYDTTLSMTTISITIPSIAVEMVL